MDDMTECKYGPKPDDQKDCDDYEATDPKKDKWKCIKFRDLAGFYHCNGLGDTTKE